MTSMLFHSWADLVRVLVTGTLSYSALVLMLRLSGKRTLSKMNAFDLVVTVALGSTFASVLLSKDVALAEGMVAFAVLVTMQFIVAWLSVRSSAMRRLVKSDPRLLFYDGQLLHSSMRAERVTEAEVRAAIRAQGISTLEDVEAVVLETNGTFTVMRSSGVGGRSVLPGTRGFPGSS